MRTFQTVFFATGLLLFAAVGCSNTATTPEEAASDSDGPSVTLVNSVCPIMGGKAKNSVTADWDGKTVGFCCPGCIPKWEKLSDEEKAAEIASANAKADDENDDDHDHDHGSGHAETHGGTS